MIYVEYSYERKSLSKVLIMWMLSSKPTKKLCTQEIIQLKGTI